METSGTQSSGTENSQLYCLGTAYTLWLPWQKKMDGVLEYLPDKYSEKKDLVVRKLLFENVTSDDIDYPSLGSSSWLCEIVRFFMKELPCDDGCQVSCLLLRDRIHVSVESDRDTALWNWNRDACKWKNN